MMKVESPEEVDGEEEILFEPKGDQQGPEIPLHAMERTTSPKTFRLLGLVNRKPMSILLDTGSTQIL